MRGTKMRKVNDVKSVRDSLFPGNIRIHESRDAEKPQTHAAFIVMQRGLLAHNVISPYRFFSYCAIAAYIEHHAAKCSKYKYRCLYLKKKMQIKFYECVFHTDILAKIILRQL